MKSFKVFTLIVACTVAFADASLLGSVLNTGKGGDNVRGGGLLGTGLLRGSGGGEGRLLGGPLGGSGGGGEHGLQDGKNTVEDIEKNDVVGGTVENPAQTTRGATGGDGDILGNLLETVDLDKLGDTVDATGDTVEDTGTTGARTTKNLGVPGLARPLGDVSNKADDLVDAAGRALGSSKYNSPNVDSNAPGASAPVHGKAAISTTVTDFARSHIRIFIGRLLLGGAATVLGLRYEPQSGSTHNGPSYNGWTTQQVISAGKRSIDGLKGNLNGNHQIQAEIDAIVESLFGRMSSCEQSRNEPSRPSLDDLIVRLIRELVPSTERPKQGEATGSLDRQNGPENPEDFNDVIRKLFGELPASNLWEQPNGSFDTGILYFKTVYDWTKKKPLSFDYLLSFPRSITT